MRYAIQMANPAKRTEHIQIRVTPAEKRAISKAAKDAGLDVASYLRSLALTKRKR